jgi:RimJ/RimL family protein N-acetyltransferase
LSLSEPAKDMKNRAKVILKTERLFLREMNMGDYDALYKILADSDIMRHYPYTFDERRVRGWIEHKLRGLGVNKSELLSSAV